jgi:ABC-type multidrug transport system ATPase subunit
MTPEFFCEGKNVRLGYSKQALGDRFDFSFPRGALVALIGRNGAGKSTLLRALLGEPVHLEGELHWAEKNAPGVWATVPQENVYPAHLRLRDFLRLAFLGRTEIWRPLPDRNSPAIDEALAAFGMETLGDRPLGRLSTGERQRAFLARALMQKPRFLLLDEPTNHLDPEAAAAFWRQLLQERSVRPFEIIVSTHDLAFVKKQADWIGVLEKGALVFSGSADRFWAAGGFEKVFPALVKD